MGEINIQKLVEKSNELANHITRLHFEHNPGLLERYGEAGKTRCFEDAVFHLNFLAEALTMNLPDMYANYILWAASMLKSRNIPESDLDDNLDYVQQAIYEILGSEYAAVTNDFIAAAKEKLNEKFPCSSKMS
jgi:hypothetical protein